MDMGPQMLTLHEIATRNCHQHIDNQYAFLHLYEFQFINLSIIKVLHQWQSSKSKNNNFYYCALKFDMVLLHKLYNQINESYFGYLL